MVEEGFYQETVDGPTLVVGDVEQVGDWLFPKQLINQSGEMTPGDVYGFSTKHSFDNGH